MPTNISIPINRKRFPSVLIIGLLLTASLIYNVSLSIPTQLSMDDLLMWSLKIALLVALVFYTSISLVSYLKVLFDKNAMLKLTDTAMIDNSSIFSCGEILWEDIADVTMKKGINMQFLMVKLKNPEKYLPKSNFLKRYFIQNRIKKLGTPIILSETHLKCNIDVLREIILEHAGK
jgi:hypothetical protein